MQILYSELFFSKVINLGIQFRELLKIILFIFVKYFFDNIYNINQDIKFNFIKIILKRIIKVVKESSINRRDKKFLALINASLINIFNHYLKLVKIINILQK